MSHINALSKTLISLVAVWQGNEVQPVEKVLKGKLLVYYVRWLLKPGNHCWFQKNADIIYEKSTFSTLFQQARLH